MQVQLQDAFKAAADTAIDHLKDEMKKASIDYTAMDRNDPSRLEDADKIQIDVKGVPVAKSGSFRSLVEDQFGDWVLTAVNSTDYRLNMKQSEALRLKADTMTQTIHTIERKINGLGLAETTVVPTGRSSAEAELLVEMPGVDDPAHVKQLLQTQAVLEWDEVKDGPFAIAGRSAGQARRRAAAEHQAGAIRGARRPAAGLVPGFPHPDRARHRYSRRPRLARATWAAGRPISF